MGGSLPFRSGVVVSLHPLSVCLGSLWLVTALFPSLSLYLPVPIFSWLLLLLRQVPWVCCLAFPRVVHTLTVGLGFLMPALRPPSDSWYTGSSGFSSPLRFPTFAMGSPLRGRGSFVLDRNEGLVSIWVRYTGQFLAGPPTFVCGYLRALSLRVCCQVVLAMSINFGSP